MAFRGGLGPVFAYEWLTATRRWQMYAGRTAFVGVLLIGLIFVWINRFPGQANLTTYRVQAEIARTFFQTLVLTELVMVMLAAPAATAGAICLDKARGSLLQRAGDGPVRRRGRVRQARRQARAGARLVACSLPVPGAGDLARRNRPGGPDRLVPGDRGRDGARLRSGLDDFGLGQEDARSPAGNVRCLGHLGRGNPRLVPRESDHEVSRLAPQDQSRRADVGRP